MVMVGVGEAMMGGVRMCRVGSAIKKKKGSHSLFSLTCCLSRHKGVTKSNNQLRRKCLESVDMIYY